MKVQTPKMPDAQHTSPDTVTEVQTAQMKIHHQTYKSRRRRYKSRQPRYKSRHKQTSRDTNTQVHKSQIHKQAPHLKRMSLQVDCLKVDLFVDPKTGSPGIYFKDLSTYIYIYIYIYELEKVTLYPGVLFLLSLPVSFRYPSSFLPVEFLNVFSEGPLKGDLLAFRCPSGILPVSFRYPPVCR